MEDMNSKAWRWVLGLIYIVTVAAIWIAASFVVQSVVDGGVSPFLVTYICNSLFVIYIPLVEIGHYLEDNYGGLWSWRSKKSSPLKKLGESEKTILLGESDEGPKTEASLLLEVGETSHHGENIGSERRHVLEELAGALPNEDHTNGVSAQQVDNKGRWTRFRTAKVSLLICPFWFLAQLTFNLSLKYTTVTVSISELCVAHFSCNLLYVFCLIILVIISAFFICAV